jgi:hypothetical protein
MNNTNFTTADLRKVIPVLIDKNIGITTSSSYCNNDLCEFSKNEDIVIDVADIDGDVVDIEFHQDFHCYNDDFENESFKYRTLVEVEDIKKILNAINN